MTFLIDTNIILDILINRAEFVKESSFVWKLCEIKRIKGCVSSLSFANLVYIMRKELNPKQIEVIYNKLNQIFEFVDLTTSDLSKATRLQWNDYEDSLQSVIASRIKADYIVTRNPKDFVFSKVPCVTPKQLMNIIYQ